MNNQTSYLQYFLFFLGIKTKRHPNYNLEHLNIQIVKCIGQQPCFPLAQLQQALYEQSCQSGRLAHHGSRDGTCYTNWLTFLVSHENTNPAQSTRAGGLSGLAHPKIIKLKMIRTQNDQYTTSGFKLCNPVRKRKKKLKLKMIRTQN